MDLRGLKPWIAGALFLSTMTASAQVMTSSNYKIQSDSVNIGGQDSAASVSYGIFDTVGEAGTDNSSSANYGVHAGYRQMQEVYLAISTVAAVTMDTPIGGVSGGTSNGSTVVTVTTDDPAGYSLSIKASTSPALIFGSFSFADYTLAGSNPDFTFSVLPADSEFAFTPEGADIVQKYKDNGSSCNTGSLDTAGACWNGLSTTAEVIAQGLPNQPSGTVTTIKFRAYSGSAHLQVNGTYVATSTLTALAL